MIKLRHLNLAKTIFLLIFLSLTFTNASARLLESPFSEEVIAVPNSDNEPPVTTATIGQPQYNMGDRLYIAGSTPVSLTAVDYGITPSGIDYIEYRIDSEAGWTRYTNPFTLGSYSDGPHIIYYRAADKVGNIENAKLTSLILDKNAPLTTTTLTGIQGSNGWYISNVTVELTATDGGSGVETIKYSINDVDTVVAGSITSFVLASDGKYTIKYCSVDHLGNMEEQKSVTINIDKTPPTLTVTANPNILWPPNHKMVDIKIDGSAGDEMSGIASIVITITDEYEIYNMTVPQFGSTIQLEAWREGTDADGRVYTITAIVTDMAGNQFGAETKVVVPHDMW